MAEDVASTTTATPNKTPAQNIADFAANLPADTMGAVLIPVDATGHASIDWSGLTPEVAARASILGAKMVAGVMAKGAAAMADRARAISDACDALLSPAASAAAAQPIVVAAAAPEQVAAAPAAPDQGATTKVAEV